MQIYTDGSCECYKGTNVGGIGVVIYTRNFVLEYSEILKDTTPIIAEVVAITRSYELVAGIRAKIRPAGTIRGYDPSEEWILEDVKVKPNVIHCDSLTLVNLINKKLPWWIKHDQFKKSMSQREIALWRNLYYIRGQARHKFDIQHVDPHKGIFPNELAHELAQVWTKKGVSYGKIKQ